MTTLLECEHHYQRYEGSSLKPGRIGEWHQLITGRAHHTTMLVAEDYFDYYSYTISLTSPTPFAAKDLKEIIRQKYQLLQHKYGRSLLSWYYFIDGCMVEYRTAKHVLGKTGNISFVLRMMVLKHHHTLELKKHIPLDRVTIMPQYLGLIQRLSEKFTGTFTLVRFLDAKTVCLRVQGGRYQAIETLPFGMSLLRESFKDHDIAAYLYTDIDRIQKNPLLRNSVEEVFTFFLSQVLSWMYQHAMLGMPCVILGPLAQHQVFVETFRQLSGSYSETACIPFVGSMVGSDTQLIDQLLVECIHKKNSRP